MAQLDLLCKKTQLGVLDSRVSIFCHIPCHIFCHNKPLSEHNQRINKTKSRVCVRVEHIFASITNEQGGLYSRVMGTARNTLKIGMMNTVYTMRRFITLNRIAASV